MLLEIQNVRKSFAGKNGLFCSKKQQVLQGVSLSLFERECLGLVGESGSGKSTLGRIVLGLEKPDSGRIVFAEHIAALPRVKRMSVVFQDYNSSVNPRLLVRETIAEPLRNSGLSKSERQERVVDLLDEVGLPAAFLDRYPHQLSGGQLQRVCIARAIAPNPRFILLDEAVSSLDVSIQVQILDLLLALKNTHEVSLLFITHDITVAAYMCDRLLFFRDGEVVEEISEMEKLGDVQNEYARQLLGAAQYLERPFLQEMSDEPGNRPALLTLTEM